ncbi:rhomboid family intramembrane serine protease [Bacillus sp. JJ1764]|uniref:rhomboid family intramembrane serine protease n=1 Tax=Bacillus sp. JJ1764 TaxID=3122964 RepID=UPI002FFFEBC2
MSNRESYMFWRLAFSLISEHGYRIIQLFENQRELWLEKLENKHAPIIRLLQGNFDWSNALQRDIEHATHNGESVRKQLNRHDLQVVSIYISELPPVDEYEYRFSKPFLHPEGKTTVHSFLLAKELYEQGFESLKNKVYLDLSFPIKDEYNETEVESLKRETVEFAVNRVKTERAILSNGKPLFTYVFMFIQLAIFLWMQLHGGSTNTSTLIKYGAKVNQLIYEGEWWRFITPVFLHIGFLHLVMNTLALYYLGIAVERIYGNSRFPFIYLFAGFTGVIASFLFSTHLSAGASGAIFGCFGALLYFGIMYPKLFFRTMGWNVIIVLILNLMFGFSTSGIDNAGHLGGLVGGFLAAGIVHFPKAKKPLLQLLFLVISAVVIWGSLTYGFSASGQALDEDSSIMLAQDYIKQEKFDQAYDVLNNYKKNSTEPTERIYFLLSYVEMKKDMLSEAKENLQKAIKLDPKFHEAYFKLALINLEQNDLQQAKSNAEMAAKLKPNQKEYTDLVSEISQHLKSSGEGE